MSRAALSCREACDTTTSVLSSHRSLKLKDNLITLLENAEAATSTISIRPPLPRLSIDVHFDAAPRIAAVIADQITSFGSITIHKDTAPSPPDVVDSPNTDMLPGRPSPSPETHMMQPKRPPPSPSSSLSPSKSPKKSVVTSPAASPDREPSVEAVEKEEVLLRDAIALAQNSEMSLFLQSALLEHKLAVREGSKAKSPAPTPAAKDPEDIERDTPSPKGDDEVKTPEVVPEGTPTSVGEREEVLSVSPSGQEEKESDVTSPEKEDAKEEKDKGKEGTVQEAKTPTPASPLPPKPPRTPPPPKPVQVVMWCTLCEQENETQLCEYCGLECIEKEDS
eukprot:TRINITY_DN37835_c0_g1_i1.p1 TRINITY_DN37835_c0_g1~~TRINITY_DN37835_c0_g1_i1.p1  ORF type:complete len:390 (+),score=106.56 TRINITY_DN37835_c0_g1_i1:163-1170(+)